MMQERVKGSAYDKLVDELLAALKARYGPQVLIHWEDFGAGNAFRLLAKYQDQVGCATGLNFLSGFRMYPNASAMQEAGHVALQDEMLQIIRKRLRLCHAVIVIVVEADATAIAMFSALVKQRRDAGQCRSTPMLLSLPRLIKARHATARPLITLLRGAAVQGYTTFNDDIQATAAVTLGSLYGAQRQEGVPKLVDQRFLFFGAGQANIGAAQLLTLALAQQGLSAAEARSRVWLMDSRVRPCTYGSNPQHACCLLSAVASVGHSHCLLRIATLPEGHTLTV